MTFAESSSTTTTKVDKKKQKQQKKKEQKKRQKQKKQEQQQQLQNNHHDENGATNNNNHNSDGVEQDPDFIIDENDPTFELYNKLLKHFDNPTHQDDDQDVQFTEQDQDNKEGEHIEGEEGGDNEKGDGDEEGDDDDNEGKKDTKQKKLSNRERKKQQRLNLPILKQLVDRPDIVELHDTNSPNPSFLISLKSCRNTVPVPIHWSQKRKYLQGKRGFVKPPFELPEFIAATGITKIRDALLERESQKKAKTKQRERLQPKMRTMNIDYQVLRDAFFVHQTKPKLTGQGDLYYEGKEFEVSIKKNKPGQLSAELKNALGMLEGYPPPWLIHMQSHGPPPSYPGLKVPGVNAPIPEGAQYGFHPGGWGNPPMDPSMMMFANQNDRSASAARSGLINKEEREHWGQLIPEEELEEEDEELEEEDQQEQEQDSDMPPPLPPSLSAQQVQDGTSSIPSGLETPDVVDIRKQPPPSQQKQLYHVIEQSSRQMGQGIMESNYKYNLPTTIKTSTTTSTPSSTTRKVDLMKSQRSGPVEVTLNPSEMEDMNELDEELLKKKYEQAVSGSSSSQPRQSKEDYSDLVDDHKKRKAKSQDDKQKKFKF